MKLNKDEWLISQIDAAKILLDSSLQHVPNLEGNIYETVIEAALDGISNQSDAKIPFGPKTCDQNGQPLYTEKQLKEIQIMNELSLWGNNNPWGNHGRRQRGFFIIPCNDDNALYQLLLQYHQTKNQEYCLVHYLGRAWVEVRVGADDPLDHTILKHFLVAMPYVDNQNFLAELFGEFYDRLSITATI